MNNVSNVSDTPGIYTIISFSLWPNRFDDLNVINMVLQSLMAPKDPTNPKKSNINEFFTYFSNVIKYLLVITLCMPIL